MKRIFIIFSLGLICALSAQAQELTTFVLIRHAEKASDGTRDPGLTAEGEDRAARFKAMFAKAEVSAIYSTPYRRTKSTVQPLADALNKQILEYNPRNMDFLDEILTDHAGGLVIISGHSNTTPFVANALLGKDQFGQLDESEYDKIFVVTVSEKGKGTVTLLSF